MEAAKHLIIVMILILVGTTPARPQEKSAATGSGNRMASCVVRVMSDPAVLPLSFQTVRQLMHSSGVLGKAARDVLGLAQEESLGLFDVLPLSPDFVGSPTEVQSPSSGTVPPEPSSPRIAGTRGLSGGTAVPSLAPVVEHTLVFLVEVDFRDPGLGRAIKPLAEEFMSALITNLQSALTGAYDKHIQRLRDQLKLADEEAARAENDLNQKREELRNTFGSRILDHNKILVDIGELRSDIQKTEMEQASNEVVIDETSKRIAATTDKLLAKLKDDDVVRELEVMLKLQFKNLENAQEVFKTTGGTSFAQFSDAQEKVARLKIELAQRQDQLSKSAGSNLIESLNSQLADYSIKEAQNQAKLKSLEQQLAETRQLLNKADAYELLSLKADIAKQSLQEVLVWRDRLSRQIRMLQPPAVSVIGGQ